MKDLHMKKLIANVNKNFVTDPINCGSLFKICMKID